MRNVVILALFFSSLFASSDLVELYRLKGIEQVQKELDSKLQKKDYWLNYFKDKDVSKGYYESIDHVLVCQKDLKDLKLYSTKKGSFKEEFSSSVFIGKAKGDKQKEGDLKTPVGTYQLTNKLMKNLDQFYGPMAFVTSYPNAYDKLQKKDGHGIWIHGLPFKGKRDDFTQGCIALENEGIQSLSKKFNFKNSILIIEEKGKTEVTPEDLSIVLSQMYQWKDSWKNSDINTYLSFYAPNFRKYGGMRIKQFSSYKKRLFSRNEAKTIKFEDINVMPYPNLKAKKIFKISMTQRYETKNYKSLDIKELYIEVIDGKMKILTES